MRRAEGFFYLAVFGLLSRSGHAQRESRNLGPTASRNSTPNVCAFEPQSIVSDACASYSTLDNLNTELSPHIDALTKETDFFSYYRLNLYNKKCPFWSDENDMCGNIACAVNTLDDEDDIPSVWRAHELGKLRGPVAPHPDKKSQLERLAKPLQGSLGDSVGESCVVEYDDECDNRDYCVPEDESASSKGDYVSLVDNPERYTGYTGPGAHHVWEAIYRENCFSTPKGSFHDAEAEVAPGLPFSPPGLNAFGKPNQLHASNELRNVIRQHGASQGIQQGIAQGAGVESLGDGLDFEGECIEKRVFYRVVSGMHASISTHICAEYLNRTTGKWEPNLQCYIDRLHSHPERISNLYFNYALLLRATGKICNRVNDYQFCSAEPEQNAHTKDLMQSLTRAIPPGPEIFDETVMFNGDAAELKEDFRSRFRNISRVMDCVGCDKCRLWGKLQIAGYGTALKILFEFDENDPSTNPPLRRHELVALVNTLGKVSNSLTRIGEFRKLLKSQYSATLETNVGADPIVSNKSQLGGRIKPGDVAVEDDEMDDSDMPPRRIKRDTGSESIYDMFWDEFDLVWRTYLFVLKGWAAAPSALYHITISELERLWDWSIGLPPQPRMWSFRIPNIKELRERNEL